MLQHAQGTWDKFWDGVELRLLTKKFFNSLYLNENWGGRDFPKKLRGGRGVEGSYLLAIEEACLPHFFLRNPRFPVFPLNWSDRGSWVNGCCRCRPWLPLPVSPLPGSTMRILHLFILFIISINCMANNALNQNFAASGVRIF